MEKLVSHTRNHVRQAVFVDEARHLETLLAGLNLDAQALHDIAARAAALATALRAQGKQSLIERFVAEYGLADDEGIALMCLAEAFLRTPDAPTLDALIADKIGGGDWSRHLGKAASGLVNASTWALLLTGRTFRRIPAEARDLGALMHGVVQRLGEPLARRVVGEALRILARQFVLGRTIDEALDVASAAAGAGYLHSFDMLGEAAATAADAQRYCRAYEHAIAAIAKRARATDPHANAGISIKLSALHARYEQAQHVRVIDELVPRVLALAEQARAGNIGFNIDAEEADRLDLSLAVIEAVLGAPELAHWDGFGVAVQAYAKSAPAVIDWLAALCRHCDRRIAVRLVKGAYWDTEIKRAQVLGLPTYPVLTRKSSTDVSYLVCAQRLFACGPSVYPQFATHNAHTVCAINAMAPAGARYEFQRLQGMGEALHAMAREADGRLRRIYAPVGIHRDLLAYLVRRLLENGANSSFVHQLVDTRVTLAELVADPVARAQHTRPVTHPAIPLPPMLFWPARRNAPGWDLSNAQSLAALDAAMAPFRHCTWQAAPTIDGSAQAPLAINNPAKRGEPVGAVRHAGPQQVDDALTATTAAFFAWQSHPLATRAALLEQAADLYERNGAELIALLTREAGKTRRDALAELREAIDFLRYYALQARTGMARAERDARGTFVCISPWNFPLAIFSGQVAAALVAGNTVVAKPAEQTPLIAARAVALLHEAGVPREVLILLPGDGTTTGAALVSDARVAGVCFTGSLDTARHIDLAMAGALDPRAVLIAETGGINAMIVDSTALPEQVVRDVIASAFRSAGQRCSALRVLYLQREVAPAMLTMLEGALHELTIGDPWLPATDIGPLIDAAAAAAISAHCATLERAGRLLFRAVLPATCAAGTFVAPAVFRLDRYDELQHEVFGPVLHVIEYDEHELDAIVTTLNDAGHALTLAVHSRIDTRVDAICAAAQIGNLFVNRDQIGAVVGVQPFGGVGLSGTGPKAGGPHYVPRFTRRVGAVVTPGRAPSAALQIMRDALPAALRPSADRALVRAGAVRFAAQSLPGVTGERNTYTLHPRGTVLCLGPSAPDLVAQTLLALGTGNRVALMQARAGAALGVVTQAAQAAGLNTLSILAGEPDVLLHSAAFDLVLFDGDEIAARGLRRALARRDGSRVALLQVTDDAVLLCVERVVSEDTTAAGGNTALLALSH